MLARLKSLWYRVRSFVRRDRMDAELVEEMDFHRDMLAAEAERRGTVRAEAQRLASIRLGNPSVIRERSREWWSLGWLEDAVRDARYAARFLRRAPSFTVVAVLSIALGVGANAAVFTLIDRVFFRVPAGVRDDANVRRLYLRTEGGGRPAYVRAPLAWAEYFALDSTVSGLAMKAGYSHPDPVKLGAGLDVPLIAQSLVTGDYFRILGVRSELGRLIDPSDDREDAPAVAAVVSYALWRGQFGGSADIIGRRLIVGGHELTVIGVAQRDFRGLEIEATDVWVAASAFAREALDAPWRRMRRGMGTTTIIRLRPGVTETVAAQQVSRAIQALPSTDSVFKGQTFSTQFASLVRARGPAKRDEGIDIATRLAVAAILVLLAGYSNVANLLLVRGLARRRELAVRLAIGVGRARLMAQLFTETLIICGLGALLALWVADGGGRFLRALILPDVHWTSMPVDARVVIFTIATALGFGLLAAVIPAWRASRTDVAHALKSGWLDRGTDGHRLRAVLLSLQLSLSVAILVGAGLFTRSLMRAARFDVGFDARHVLSVDVRVKPEPKTPTERWALATGASERVRLVPGVRDVGGSAANPFYSISFTLISIPGRDVSNQLRDLRAFFMPMTPTAMRALRVKTVRGRALEEGDRAGAPLVVVVSEGLANRLWPNENPLGRCMRLGGDTTPCREVVGVTRDLVTNRLTQPEAQYFAPLSQMNESDWRPWCLLVHADGDVHTAAVQIRAALRGWRPDISSLKVEPVADRMDAQMRPWRLGASVFSSFGIIALLLAAIGVYGIISFNVTRRLTELGIRAALGATRARLARLVLSGTTAIALTGVGVGVAISLIAAHWLDALLFETSSRDPVSLVGAVILLLLVALIASLGPLRVAARADPVGALKAE